MIALIQELVTDNGQLTVRQIAKLHFGDSLTPETEKA